MYSHSRRGSSFSFVGRYLSLVALGSLFTVTVPRVFSQSAPVSTTSSAALEARAEQGDARAQYELGKFLLLHNNPSGQDLQSGVHWLQASAAQRNPNAQFLLGYAYEQGRGVNRDYVRAAQNYEAAALQHHSTAANNLAALYQWGLGVPKNLGKALEWYRTAAQQGDHVAQANLASMYYLGQGTPRDQQQALRWFRPAAEAGLADAQSDLAYFYFHGIGVERDYAQAAELTKQAAAQGLPVAQANLGFLYEQGKGVPLDYVAAYAWYSRAIAGGDSSSVEQRKQLARIMTSTQRELVRNATSGISVAPRASTAATASTSGPAFSFVQH